MALCASQILNKAHLFKRQGLGYSSVKCLPSKHEDPSSNTECGGVHNHRSSLPVSLAKHMGPKVRALSQRQGGER